MSVRYKYQYVHKYLCISIIYVTPTGDLDQYKIDKSMST